MPKPVTITFDYILYKKIKQLQVKVIYKEEKAVSFSRIVNDLLRKEI